MRSLLNGLCASLVLITLGVGCRARDDINARYWITDPIAGGGPRVFPEQVIEAGVARVPRVDPRSDLLGVCFSGGGIRSASASLGQIRALERAGLMDEVDYISCVSGGSWAAVPYTFHEAARTDRFLGADYEPDKLTRELLDQPEPGSFAAVLSETEMPSWVLSAMRAIFSLTGLHDNDFYAKQLERTLLKPLGLDGSDRFLTLDERSKAELQQQNPQLVETEQRKHFRMPAADRPFLIVGGTIRRYDFWPWKWDESHNKRLPLEMTPMYVGVPHQFRDVGDGDRSVGGVYVEPAAYGAREVTQSGERIRAVVKGDLLGVEAHRFSLRDVIAISGSAPSEVGEFVASAAFPLMYLWSPANGDRKSIETYYHADGGLSENVGIMPLLARRVKKIIVFVNAEGENIPSQVRELFGERTSEYPSWHSRAVFPKAGLDRLKAAAAEWPKGKMPFVTDTYRVLPPASDDSEDVFHLNIGADEAYEVKVTWFFLEDTAWRAKLEHQPLGAKDAKGEFEHFPHYKTFANNSGRLIDPTLAQVNALSQMTSWLVRQNAQAIRNHLGLPRSTTRPTTQPNPR